MITLLLHIKGLLVQCPLTNNRCTDQSERKIFARHGMTTTTIPSESDRLVLNSINMKPHVYREGILKDSTCMTNRGFQLPNMAASTGWKTISKWLTKTILFRKYLRNRNHFRTDSWQTRKNKKWWVPSFWKTKCYQQRKSSLSRTKKRSDWLGKKNRTQIAQGVKWVSHHLLPP